MVPLALPLRMTLNSAGPDRRAVIFLHLPKTAGLTLNSIIERQYPEQTIFYVDHINRNLDDLRRMPQEERAALRCVMGHLVFGVHRLLPQSSTYITLLRDPAERVISHYYYVRNQPGHYLHKIVVEKNLSLLEYVTSGLDLELDNGQTRFISGIWDSGGAVGSMNMLDVARRNLQDSFAAFGPMERFDELLLLFSRTLGWAQLDYVRKNVTTDRPLKHEIDAQTLRCIEQHNALDMELYEWSVLRFDEQLRDHGIGGLK